MVKLQDPTYSVQVVLMTQEHISVHFEAFNADTNQE
jgi:hypothetical protein